MNRHDRVYTSILKEKLGQEYKIIEEIKHNQCPNCLNKKKCLLVIKENKCINYEEINR